MSARGFDSAECLEVFHFTTRLGSLDDPKVWFKPNGISWQWTVPAWSASALGRTPRAGLPPVAPPEGAVWGVRTLAMSRPGEGEADFDRLLSALKSGSAPGLEFDAAGDAQLARLAPLGLRLLSLGRRSALGPDGFKRIAAMESLTHLLLEVPVDGSALDAIAALPNLKVLALHGNSLVDEEVSRLRRMSRLEVLAMPETKLGDRGLAALHGLPLQVLSLAGLPEIDAKALSPFAEKGTLRDLALGFDGIPEAAVAALSRIRSLESLDLTVQQWRDGSTAGKLAALTGLKSLGLSWAPLDALEWLGDLPALRRLNLHQGTRGRSLSGVERAPALEELSVPDSSITDEMLEPLEGAGRLRALDLKSAQMSGEGLVHLQGLNGLTHLNLFNCVSITDEGIETLVRLPAVEELNLGSCVFPYEDEQTCGLTDRAAARLSELRTLRHLGIAGNRVRPETAAGLREALPGCLVDSGTMVRSAVVEACNDGEAALQDGDLAAALAAYRRALAEDGAFPPALLGSARVLDKQGDLAAADEAADRAVKIDREAESYHVRGSLRARLGRSAEAIEDFTRGLEADGRRTDLLIWRAEARLDVKDHAGAIADYTRWLERTSGPEPKQGEWLQWLPHVLSNRSYARLESGDAVGAEADSSLVVELSPGSVEALMNRAEARAKLGRKAEAKKDYEEVLRIEPGHREATRLLAEL